METDSQKKEAVAKLIINSVGKAFDKKSALKKSDVVSKIEVPPSTEMGDYAFPCFSLASKLKSGPAEIAAKIIRHVGKLPKEFDSVETKGPYVNFFLNKKLLSKNLIEKILADENDFGKNNSEKGKKILIEFSSPNIAKPFGIGHLRSTIIGNSISKISEFNGFRTINVNYLGDWGTQFGKLIFGFKKWGGEKKLAKDATKHLLEIYVKANKKIYEEKARKEFRKLETGDKENMALWKRFRELSLKDFEKIYKILNVKFDVYLGESMYEDEMKKVVATLRKKKLLKKNAGASIVDLEKYGLGVMLIQKSDGATLYATRDLASAISRHEKYKFDKMFYEVGQEQTLHLKQVFKVLELMGHKWAKELVHISHGLYLDKDGKKFATRKGKTVFMEDILNETTRLARKEIEKRARGLSEKELEFRSRKIAVAAILYGDLKNTRTNNMVFDVARFTSFDGDTGPYLLYSYARASSIIKKARSKKSKITITSLDESETALIKKLSDFPSVVESAYKSLNPATVANYSYQLAQIFNEFYHACQVIGSEKETFRIALVKSFRQVLKNSLDLLGIETLEEM